MANGEGEIPGDAAVVRICHDLAGPIGALANGIDLLTMEAVDAPEILEMLRGSACALAARLEFLRAVFGLPTARAVRSGAVAEAVARAYLEQLGDRSRRFDLAEFPAGAELPPARWRLVLALVLAGAEALPFGGRIGVAARAEELPCLRAEGRRAGWPPEVLAGFDAAAADPRAAASALVRVLAAGWGRVPVPWYDGAACGVDLVPAPLENL